MRVGLLLPLLGVLCVAILWDRSRGPAVLARFDDVTVCLGAVDLHGDGSRELILWRGPAGGGRQGLAALDPDSGRELWRSQPLGVEQPRLAVPGDLDGDGADDLVVAARTAGEGGVVTALGRGGEVLWQRIDASPLGMDLVALGDQDGDGVGDLAVSSIGPTAGPQVGVLSGANGARVEGFSTAAYRRGFAREGRALARVPDRDGDGLDELVLASHEGTVVLTGRGRLLERWPAARIVEGGGDMDGDGVGDLAFSDAYGAAWVLSGAEGQELLRVPRARGGIDFWATSLCLTSDLDGDGVGDLWVGSHDFGPEPGRPQDAGRVELFSGFDGRLLFHDEGREAFEGLGIDLVSPGDLNRDGMPEVVLASWRRSRILDGASLGRALR